MSGKNFMSFGDADTILTEFSNDIKSRVSTKANQGLTAQQKANAKTNIGIEKVPNVATNDQTPTFLEESTRTNIASGDKLSLIFGKIKKFFSDLKAVAFSGSYNDLSDIPTLVECSTARNVAAKTVTLPGFKLKTGARISVRFTDTGSSNPASGNITLNVNGTGAKEIIDGHANMTKATYTYNWFYNNQTIEFIYDGTYWVNLNRDNNTTYSSKAAASGGKATSLCTTGEKYTWNNKANTSDIPTTLSGLSDDSTHRLVTDTEKSTWNNKQNALTFDNIPTKNSNNPVKSGGIFSTMAVPKYDATNRREYYEGGSAFSGNIDSAPTAGSNNAVASGGTYTQLLSKQDASSLVPIPFTVAITSAITTIGLLDQNCYYIPATNEVRIQVMIYSANGDIPSDNKVILTIPNDYKPREVKRFMCMLGDTSNQPARAERGYVELSGTVKLNNFIYGNKAINWIFFNFSYIK